MKKTCRINKLERIFLERSSRSRVALAIPLAIFTIITTFLTRSVSNLVFCVAIFTSFYIIYFWGFRFFRSTLRNGSKIVHKASVDKVRRLGIFDPEGVSIASRMLGAAFYLWVKDEDQESGLLRLRVVKRVYEGLKNRTNDNIKLTYLTKGSFVMSVETDDFTWHAYDQSPWAKKYLEKKQTTEAQSSSDKQGEGESTKE